MKIPKAIILLLIICGFMNKLTAQNKESFDDRLFSKYLIEATGEKISGNLYLADSLYKKCLKINPNSGVVNYELSGIYKNLEQPTVAVEYAIKAVEISNENEWYLVHLALLYKDLENHKKSSETFLKLTEKSPEKVSYFFSLAEELIENNKYKKAINILNIIEGKIGLNEDLSLEKHKIYIYLKKYKNAIKELEKIIENEPDNLRTIGLLAEFYENINKPEKAKNLLDHMMEIDSSNGLVRLSLFQHYFKEKNILKSYQELQFVMKSKEVNENLKEQIILQISYDKYSPFNSLQITKLAESFLLSHKNNSPVLLLMGNLKMMTNEIDTACHYLRKSLEINSSSIEAWIQLISASLSRSKFKETIKDANNAIESHPNQPFPYLALGIAFYNNNQAEKGIKVLKQGKDLVIEDEILESDFLFELGNIHYNQNDIDESFNYFEKAIGLNPNNYILLNNYSYYLSLTKTKLNRAEELILKVLSKFPNVATYNDTYGWVLFQQKKYSLAERAIFKAVIYSNEESGEILEHYGDVLYHLDNKDGALLFWNKSKKTGDYSMKLIQKISENKFIE
jgi:tetratricopeptide (TPR) repeat protein